MSDIRLIIIGGGAAGLFAAIAAAEANPMAQVILLEKTNVLLAKVRISGGGRCNVTHACFDPKLLVKNYPRGGQELLGPFHRFQPRDTIAWFESRGVELKTEEDGRMFPTTDQSQTIIDCLLEQARKSGVEIRLKQRMDKIERDAEGFKIFMSEGEPLICQGLLLATGSSPQGHEMAKTLGHTVQPLVPSLFTFNVPTSPLLEMAGITLDDVELKIEKTALKQQGPMLLTHWGFSGPAALKLSAWAAKELHVSNYHVNLIVNWLPSFSEEEILSILLKFKRECPTNGLTSEKTFPLPRNLWKKLLELTDLDPQKRVSEVPDKHLQKFAQRLHGDVYKVEGKTTYKQEFVTCGGVTLREVNFKTMESRVCSGLYFAGEILDIDGVTGGFNFQNAWTTGWLAGQAMGLINKN